MIEYRVEVSTFDKARLRNIGEQFWTTHVLGFTPPENNQAFINGLADSPTAEGPLWAGSWPKYDELMNGAVTAVINGERTIVLDLAASPMKDRPAEGHVGFQDEAKRVWYRNVRIKELK